MRKLFLIMMAVIACTWSAVAQTRTISGTVLDAANNEPLIGATIMPIGGGNGAAADLDGNFTLTVPANVKKATVSYVGFESKTVELTPGMKVLLSSTETTLDNVVVVAYGTASKESLTGSVAVVGAKEIEDRPVTSATAALEGNAPGVQVNNTVGNPGSSPSIIIRGINSINGSSSPLYVVDGVPYSGSIADLNPADIESMSVLKDAASSALYGNKGANGVILITTKKAKKVGKIDVTLTVRQGLYQRGLPEYDRLGANDWMNTMFQGALNGELSADPSLDYASALANVREQFGDNYAQLSASSGEKGITNIYGVPNNELFDENGRLIPTSPLPGYTDLDWWKAVSQTGHRQEYNVNAAAASEKYNIFASVGYMKENGYILRTDFERYSARVNANFQPTSYLKFGVNLAATQQESDQASFDSTSVSNPFLTMFTAPIIPVYNHNAEGQIIYGADGSTSWYQPKGGSNVAELLRKDITNQSATVLDGSIYGTAVIPYGFELTVRGNMHRDKSNSFNYMNPDHGSAMGFGSLSMGFGDYRDHTFMQQLNWGQLYGDHKVDVLLDHENYQYSSTVSQLLNQNMTLPDRFGLSNFITNVLTAGGSVMERSESYLGRAKYNYDQKYFAEFSLRRDGTSRFAKDTRWGTFWSVGGTWVITREKFMQRVPWIDFLKLRAAYGSVGNNATASAFAYMALYTDGMGDYSNRPTMIPAQLAADNVRWEATKTFDIALEGNLFNSRLNFSIGYFNKRNSDLLFNVSRPTSAGAIGNTGANPTILQNIGTMQNWGWELSFSGDIIRNREVLWTASIDATFMKNSIVKLPYKRNILSPPYSLSVGKSRYEYYMPVYAGVDQMTGNALYCMDPSSHDYFTTDETTGEYGFSQNLWNQALDTARSSNALYEINGKYYTDLPSLASKNFCGTAMPTVYGSFGTQFSWKGINLGLLFTYSLGGKTLDSNYLSLMSMSTGSTSALHKDLLKSWSGVPEGMYADSPNRIDPNGIPQLNTERSEYNNNTSSRFLTSSNYLVFKNLNVSYDLPKKWVAPLQLQNLNIGMSADNLFTVTARKGMNPQQSWSGSQSAGYVTARVFSFQLTARF